MKKKFLASLVVVLLTSCGENGNKPEEITKSLKEVMTSFLTARNYTYTVDDEIFDITTTLRYTENAYYYQPSKTQHGGEAHGYAENSKGVYKYYIADNGEVVFDNYLNTASGDYVKNLWGTTILSFADLDVNSLPTTPSEGNKYLIEDPYNKLLISGLAGFGDSALQEYINVYIELTSNTTFKTTVHTYGLVGQYIGYAYGTVSSIGTTKIEEIENVLDNDGGPVGIDETLINMLKTLKESKNFTLTLSGEVNCVDIYTVRNYYSKDADDDSKSKGYAGSEYGVFSYKIENGEVVAGEVISNGTNGTFDSIWNMSNFNSLSNLNLSSLRYSKNNEGIYTITDYSTINNFSSFAHMGYSQEDDALTLKINDDGIDFVFTRGEQVVNGKVNNLGTSSIPEIESYISSGNGPLVYEDIDDYGRTFLSNLKKARNYTLNIKSNYVNRSFELTKKYTSTSYYQDYKDDQDDYGYIEENSGVYKLENQNGTINKTDKVKDEGTFLWASSLFKSFSDLDTSSLSGKKISPNTYTITDSTNKNLLCEIAGFGIYDLMFYLDKVTMTILDETTLSCQFEIKLKEGYGNVIIVLENYNNTNI